MNGHTATVVALLDMNATDQVSASYDYMYVHVCMFVFVSISEYVLNHIITVTPDASYV